jgi:hypothetical protein
MPFPPSDQENPAYSVLVDDERTTKTRPAASSADQWAETQKYHAHMMKHIRWQSIVHTLYLVAFTTMAITLMVVTIQIYNAMGKPLMDPANPTAMLNPSNINGAVANVYSTLASGAFIAQFASNVTGNMWQPDSSAIPDIPGPGTYGERFTAALVNTTSHVGAIIQAVQPSAVGTLVNKTAVALGSLNSTALGESVQALLTQASGIAAEVKQSINPEDIKEIVHHVSEIDMAAEIDRTLTLGDKALTMVGNMGKAT